MASDLIIPAGIVTRERPWGSAPTLNRASPLSVGLVSAVVAPCTQDLVTGYTFSGNYNPAGHPSVAGTGFRMNVNNQGLRMAVAPPSLAKLKLPITIAAHAVFTAVAATNANIFGICFDNAQATPFSVYALAIDGSLRLGASFNANGSFTTLAGLVPVPGVVYSMIFTIANQNQNFYQNGVLITTTAGTGDPTCGVGPIYAIGEYLTTLNRTANMIFLDGAVWNRILPPTERELYDKSSPWDLYAPTKKYLFTQNVPDLSVPKAQGPRPQQFMGLETRSPQANGLVLWLPAVNGRLLQAVVPGPSRPATGIGKVINDVNRVVDVPELVGLDTRPEPDHQLPTDLGLVVRTSKDMANVSNVRAVYANVPWVDLSGLTDCTFVYWIYPLQRVFKEAGYWTWTQGTNIGMTDSSVAFASGGQALTFANGDPHVIGRWQMITVSRTLAGIKVWRDLELVESGTSAGVALATAFANPVMYVGGVSDLTASGADGVNALWADFRVYNRAWTQNDVNYAHAPYSRWDYYRQSHNKPYEDIPIVIPSTAFNPAWARGSNQLLSGGYGS